jgi:methylated-DNA-[protein]-cysteine S-methyltransferase
VHERLTELVRRAEAEGLVDVAYAETDSPVGRLLLASTERGLARVSFELEGRDNVLEELAERLSPRVLEAPAKLDDVRRELDEYFEGRRHEFDVPLDWSLITSDFRRRVLERTAGIPYGGTLTYRDVAAAAGNERAVRAAGSALGSNPIAIVVPCHRVLRTGGSLGGYGGGLDRKRFLLDLEAGRSALA